MVVLRASACVYSITAGAVTTVLSGVFLFGCMLSFFSKFAFLIVWTIFTSYIWYV